jgi:hypothetical protein
MFIYWRKLNSAPRCIWSLYKKTYSKVSNCFDKKMYISIIYVCLSSFTKKNVIYVKKEKIYLVISLFLTPNCLFTRATQKSICHETTLWACSTWRCTCQFFASIFLTFQNMSNMHFKIKGAYAIMCQNITLVYWTCHYPVPYLDYQVRRQ